MTAGVDGSVDPEDAALDNRRERRPGVFGDGVPVPSLVDQGVRGDESVGRMSRRLTPFFGPARAEYERGMSEIRSDGSIRSGTSQRRCGGVGDGTVPFLRYSILPTS